MNQTKIIPITVSLDREAHERAQHLAAQQKTVSQGKQVYLNTLAVCAVSYYLKWLQIESDLENSDRVDLLAISNSADLLIPDCGRLECRRVLPQENYLTIPAQATEERIGYVAVQFAEDLDRVKLIGFLPPVTPASDSLQIPYRVQLRGFSPPVTPASDSLQIPLTKLQSLELLLQKISQPISQRTKSRTSVNLGQWWSEIFEPGWVDLETLFSIDALKANPAWQVRTEELKRIDTSNPLQVRRGKLIDLGVKLGNNVFALVITCTSLTNAEVEILLQVYPGDDRVYLPANLEMVVFDETETLVPQLQVRSREADNCIQLSLIGVSGERFSFRLTQEEISFTESFQL